MAEDCSIRKSLQDLLVRQYSEAYKDLWETWKIAEIKAQGVIVASGFFLAALVAFLTKSVNPAQQGLRLPPFTMVAIVGVAICVALAITFASVALLVREVTSFPPLGYLPTYIHDALKESDEKLEDEQRMLRLHEIDMWKDCISDVESKIQKKVGYLQKAQITILIATFIVAIFVVIRTIFPNS